MYGDPVPGAQPMDPIGWKPSELVLVHSLLGRARHVTLGRWPLRGLRDFFAVQLISETTAAWGLSRY